MSNWICVAVRFGYIELAADSPPQPLYEPNRTETCPPVDESALARLSHVFTYESFTISLTAVNIFAGVFSSVKHHKTFASHTPIRLVIVRVCGIRAVYLKRYSRAMRSPYR